MHSKFVTKLGLGCRSHWAIVSWLNRKTTMQIRGNSVKMSNILLIGTTKDSICFIIQRVLQASILCEGKANVSSQLLSLGTSTGSWFLFLKGVDLFLLLSPHRRFLIFCGFFPPWPIEMPWPRDYHDFRWVINSGIWQENLNNALCSSQHLL